MLNRVYVWAFRRPIFDRKIRIMIIQSASSQPGLVKGSGAFLGNPITTRISEHHKRMEGISQQLYLPNCIERSWYTHQTPSVPRKSTPDYDWATMSLYTYNLVFRIHGFMNMTKYSPDNVIVK
ncbi:hypothetical protein TNCV_695521 [Trichonephila clavipes]|nr:hypothetical protein TNCV_695521 [Trichonephila clavipes]